MSLRDPDPFWLDRWNALRSAIASTCKECEEGTLFCDLLNALSEFGTSYFDYFFVGFSSQEQREKYIEKSIYRKIPILVADDEYPPDYVMRAIVNCVSYDLETVQRAIFQRGKDSDNARVNTLNLVDAWGRGILEKFSDPSRSDYTQLLNVTPWVISYFSHFPHIRVIPYANVALMGIPFTASQPQKRRDLLVVPHELGHYVYQHGSIGDRSVRDVVADLVPGGAPFLHNWIEELFADVFAIAASDHREAMVHWVLTMIRDNPAGSYWKENKTHPIDAVRMFIYLIPSEMPPELAKILRDQWIANTAAKGNDIYTPDNKDGTVVAYDIESLRALLEPLLIDIGKEIGVGPQGIVSQLHELLPSSFEQNAPPDNVPDLPAVGPTSDIIRAWIKLFAFLVDNLRDPQSWYAQFESDLEENYGDRHHENVPYISLSKPHESLVHSLSPLTAASDSKETVSVKRWKDVLFGTGWATKGPQTGPPTGVWEGDPDDWRLSGVHA